MSFGIDPRRPPLRSLGIPRSTLSHSSRGASLRAGCAAQVLVVTAEQSSLDPVKDHRPARRVYRVEGQQHALIASLPSCRSS